MQILMGRKDCFVCKSGGSGKCEENCVGYWVKCETCQLDGRLAQYDGETGSNGYTRALEHQNALRLKDENNALWKHCVLEHGGVKPKFKMKCLGGSRSCLERQVNEAVRIEMSKADCVMNSRAEFHQAPLVRVVTVVGLQEEQGEEEQGRGQQGGARGGRGRVRQTRGRGRGRNPGQA